MLQMALAEAENNGEAASTRVVAIRRYVTQAKNSGMLLLSLINDILDITRIETGQMALDISPFLLGSAIEEAVTHDT